MLGEEAQTFTTEYGTKTGRRLVWGFIDERPGSLRHWTTLEEYEAAARPVPGAAQMTNWKAAYWSPFPGEEAVIYAPFRDGADAVLQRIDTDSGQIAEIIPLECNGVDCRNMLCYNWTRDQRLLCSYGYEDFSRGGWEIDVRAPSKQFVTQTPSAWCTDERKRWPDMTHGHGSTSPSGELFANNYGSGYGKDKGVQDCRTGEFTLDLTPYIPGTSGASHVSWKASEAWFLGSDCGPCEWEAAPNIGDYSLYQIFFDGSAFTYHKLLSMPSAGKWDLERFLSGDESTLNYSAHPIATLSRDGRMAVFMSTDGKYTHNDFELTGATPWGLEGLFLADLAPVDGGSIFSDVPASHWAYADVEKLYQGGYVVGCQATPQRKYCPEAMLSRAEAAVFVVRGVRSASFTPPQPAQTAFTDVSLSHWAVEWIEQLRQDGFTSGCATGPLRFCAETPHTRAEATVFFVRMLRGKDYLPSEPASLPYTDVARGTWYAKWVAAAYDAGLTRDCEDPPNRGDDRFRPGEAITRAEAACMMVRAKGLLLGPE